MNKLNKSELIQELPVFSGISQDELNELAKKSKLKSISKYKLIYKQGETTSALFFLINGVVKIGCHSTDGKEVIKSIIHPRSLFGELGIIGEKNRNEFASSLNSKVDFLEIPIESIVWIMRRNQSVSFALLSSIGKRLSNAERRLEALVFKDARERIIDFLKNNASKFGRQVGFETVFKHNLTQQDIANYTGTSRQTVTSVLNDLRKSNQIYFNRNSFLIRDVTKLM